MRLQKQTGRYASRSPVKMAQRTAGILIATCRCRVTRWPAFPRVDGSVQRISQVRFQGTSRPPALCLCLYVHSCLCLCHCSCFNSYFCAPYLLPGIMATNQDCTFAWVRVLPAEVAAAKMNLDCVHDDSLMKPRSADGNTQIFGSTQGHNVIIAYPKSKMSFASVVRELRTSFKSIRHILIVGI